MPGPNKHIVDETGNDYGYLRVISRAENINGSAAWNCVCDCGNTTIATGTNLRAGHVTTCGHKCPFNVAPTRFQERHGYAKTILYHKYNQAKQRCYNRKQKSYKNYGGRGITMYSKWKNNFIAFRYYVLKNLGPCPQGKSIDRIDNDKGYFPGNLRWATNKEQIDNQRHHNQYTKNND